jgi:hypothetical protein
MNPTLEQFFDTSKRYLFAARLDDVGDPDRGTAVKEVTQMRVMDERSKHGMASRMKDVVINPPQRVFARELLARGMSANEIWQLVMHDPAFVRVPEAFRIAVANAAREMAAEQSLAAARKTASQPRRNT